MNVGLPIEELFMKKQGSIEKNEETWEPEKNTKMSSDGSRSSFDEFTFSTPEYETENGDAAMREFFNFDELPQESSTKLLEVPPSLSIDSSPNLSNSQDDSEESQDRSAEYMQPHIDTAYPFLISNSQFSNPSVFPPVTNLQVANDHLDGTTELYSNGDAIKQFPNLPATDFPSAVINPSYLSNPTFANENLSAELPLLDSEGESFPISSAPFPGLQDYIISVNHVPAVNEQKWRSRVETNMLFQIQIRSANDGAVPFKYIRLPNWAHREEKKRSSKKSVTYADPREYLQLIPTVMAGDDTNNVVHTCCIRCLLRERKRNARSQATKDACMPNYTKLKACERTMADATPEEKHNFQIKLLNQFPKLEDIDERKMIMVFTGPEFVPLEPNEYGKIAHINARITCYSSHQSCPYFRLTWDLYCSSNLVAHLSFPEPITVLDDHKTRNAPKVDKQGKKMNSTNHQTKQKVTQNLIPASVDSVNRPTEKRRKTLSEINSYLQPQQWAKSDMVSEVSNILEEDGITNVVPNIPTLHVSNDYPASPSTNNHQVHLDTINNEAMKMDTRHIPHELSPYTQLPNAFLENDDAKIGPYMSNEERCQPILRTPEFNKQNVISSASATPSPPQSREPLISRVIPNRGSIMGGYEVTILGANFFNGLVCLFGETPAAVTFSWSDSTIIATCPPATMAETVPVKFVNYPMDSGSSTVTFTYEDNLDNELFKLTVQVLGLKLTGAIQNPLTLSKKLLSSWRDDFAQYITNSIKPTSNQDCETSHDFMSERIESLKSMVSQVAKEHNVPFPNSLENSVLAALSIVEETKTTFPTDFDVVNESGRTLLHYSVAAGLASATTFLINAGADVNKRDSLGYTPLHYAALYQHLDIYLRLLSKGALPDLAGANDKCPNDLASTKFKSLVAEKEKESFTLLDEKADTENGITLKQSSTVEEIKGKLWSRSSTLFPSLQELPQNYMSEVPLLMQKAMVSTLRSISAIPDDVPPPYSEVADEGHVPQVISDDSSKSAEHNKSAWWSLKWQSRLVGRGKTSALTPEETKAIQEQAKTLKKAGLDLMLFSFWLPALLVLTIFGLRSYAQLIGGYLYQYIIGA